MSNTFGKWVAIDDEVFKQKGNISETFVCSTSGNRERAKLIAESPELLACLEDAVSRLEGFIGSDCECDNTHTANDTKCCLCQYREVILKAKGSQI